MIKQNSKIKIMYLEDDESIAEIYMLMIKENYSVMDVVHFYNGQQAIDELKKNPEKYSLIISDFKMPGASGGDVFHFVKGQMLGIPFIFLSGLDFSSMGINDFYNSHVRNAAMVKPALVDELVEKIKWCLKGERDILKIYNKNASSCDEKVAIRADVFLRLNIINCDVYLKLNDGKFVKIINKKEIFESSLIKKLIFKGVKNFYINRSELSAYSETVIKSLSLIIKIKKDKIDDFQKSQLTGRAIDILKGNLIKCGFSEAILEAADKVVDMQLELIQKEPGFEEYLNKYQQFRKESIDHSRLVSYISVAILKELTWDSESTLHRMCMASLLHDISLPDRFFKTICTSKSMHQLNDDEMKTYLRHPEESSHVAKNFESLTGGIEQFILEHHELPDGNGFPRKLNFHNIHPLSAVLHVSDYASELLAERDFNFEDVKKIIQAEKAFYLRGFYRKPYESLCKVFKIL